jgi:putative Mn2+ efflux pump MntP
MGLIEIVVIALGLSMDAFAVSLTLGLSVKKLKIREIIIPGTFFGFFQAFMPAIGYFAGIYFANKIQAFDHWIAFALLGIIGGKMIKESLSKENETKEQNKNSFQLLRMLVLAIGITFAFFKVNIVMAIIITGLTTFFISMGGVKTGNIFGIKFKSKAEFFGGAVLIILGIKIVIEHLFFN